MEYSLLIFAAMTFGLVVAVLWIILPFAVFGIKNRLDKLIRQNEALIDLQQR